ncbi:hypothetical protein D3C78_1478190 [compost metagenome]
MMAWLFIWPLFVRSTFSSTIFWSAPWAIWPLVLMSMTVLLPSLWMFRYCVSVPSFSPISRSFRSRTSPPLAMVALEKSLIVSTAGVPTEPWSFNSHLNVSLPAPPINVSSPLPPISVSLPEPPSSVSLPAPPFRVSVPAPPYSTSLPSSPYRVSLPPWP